jgi:RNA polymerase sigma-70 factor (ECF subfamily)
METCKSSDEMSVRMLSSAATDEILVEAAQLGDRPAFAELWKRHSSKPYKMVYRITGNQEDAEDVIQDAWMKAYSHLKTFDGRSAFSTWLTRIAINAALMKLRRKRTHPEHPMESTDGDSWQQVEIADQTKDVEQQYIGYETAQRARRAIGGLTPSLRAVVEIHQSNDLSVKEIAGLVGISITATKSRLFRARTILREALR